MAIHDIIRRNEERLFIVDTECFIIFTGDSITDRKPFIRIGNWLDLPAEIIPLVENIIVTDSLAGNPAHEQFNIDIKYLPTNRYIGSSHVVKRFLEFQSYFGLDLHNASIIDADKDIPDISKKSAVSNNDDFIGVFYRNGNFKVTQRGTDLFDLHEYHDSQSSDKGAHERLASLAKPRRYAGSGFVVIEHNPMFYSSNSFTSYLFPHTYFPSFYSLGINPRAIASVIHPTENYLGISRYLKWRNASGGKITLYTDHDENPSTLHNLFPGVKIIFAPFTGMKAETSAGLSVSQVNHSFNITGEFQAVNAKTQVRFAYMKGISELKRIAKENLDLVLMNYSVFEDSSYLSKSFRAPVLLIDDGNPSVRKVPALDNPVIRNGMQYEVDKCDAQEILSRITEYLPSDTADKILSKDETFLESLIPSQNTDFTPEEHARFFNTLSYLRYMFLTTQDRKYSSLAKKILREGYAHHARDTFYDLGHLYRIDLIISGGTVYEFARLLADPPPMELYLLDHAHTHEAFDPSVLSDETERALYRRITDDRNRLIALLDLFLENPEYRREVAALKKAIEERKALFRHEKTAHAHAKHHKSSGFIKSLRESIGSECYADPSTSAASSGHTRRASSGIIGRLLNALGAGQSSSDSSSSGINKAKGHSSGIIGILTRIVGLDRSRTGSSRSGNVNSHDKKSGLANDARSSTSNDLRCNDARKSAGSDGSGVSGIIFSAKRIPHKTAMIIRRIKSSRAARRVILAMLALVLITIAVLFAGKIRVSYLQYKEQQTRIAKIKAEEAERRRLTAEYNIEVREYDVYIYANETAIKNGYAPITLADYKNRRNPNWIYPGNVFVLLDNTKVTVIEGDTLWNLAKDKIIKKHLAFFKVYDKVRADHTAGKKIDQSVIDLLRGLAFNEPQRKLVAEMEQRQSK